MRTTLDQVKYVLYVRPDTDKRRKDSSTYKARHKKDGNESFGEVVLFAIEGIHVWALEPIGTFG